MSHFVHLHTHSDHSLLDGLSHVDELVARAKELGMPAVALTDHGTISGAPTLFREAAAAGVKPIIGCELYIARRGMRDKEAGLDRDPFHLGVLARNEVGYRNLCRLITLAHTEGFYYKPRLDLGALRDHAEGLVCLSGCKGGEVAQALLEGDDAAAETVAREYREAFGENYFLELQDHGTPEDVAINAGLLGLSRKLGVPVVATGDSHYVLPEDARAHDALLCVQTNSRLDSEKRLRFEGTGFHLAADKEMRRLFGNDPVDNAGALGASLDFRLPVGLTLLPEAPLPDGAEANQVLAERALNGLKGRFGDVPPPEAYVAQLQKELGVIQRTGFAPYFLIVSDFTDEARRREVGTGPGRGSAAGSLVSYSLGITKVDPVQYGLVFERFLNEERVSMPDIDIDFEPKGRDELIAYARERYGEDRVAQIATFGTLGGRGSIRDVGRVLGIPIGQIDPIAKLVPAGASLAQVVDDPAFQALVDACPQGRELVRLAGRLEGTLRSVGTHASGVVISPVPLQNLMPLQRPSGNGTGAITQFDLAGISALGLLKVDFLGLDNLTMIREACALVRQSRGEVVDPETIPSDDPAAMALLARGDTVGIFQFEQSGAQEILREMRPRSLLDLAAANALNRPGPLMGRVAGGHTIVELYMRRRRGDETLNYPTPECEPYLRDTEGLMLYQDQVMQVAAVVAGYSMGEADVLRAAMGKKDSAKMADQRERFVRGAIDRGQSQAAAQELFDTISTFAGYGFNKAHALSYALIGYQTAYLKAHYPVEFTTALLNCRSGELEKMGLLVRDARAHEVEVLAPSVQEPSAVFSVAGVSERGGKVRFGLIAVKGVGRGAAEAIVDARASGQAFSSLENLVARLPGGSCNRRALEALIRVGACDGLGERNGLLAALPLVQSWAAKGAHNEPALFGEDEPPLAFPDVAPMPAPEKLQCERELCGAYLSGHPADQAGARLWSLTTVACADAGHIEGMLGRVGGVVTSVQVKRTRFGKDMAIAEIEDQTGVCRVVVPPKAYPESGAALRPGALVVVAGRIEESSGAERRDGPETVGLPASCVADRVLGIDDPQAAHLRPNALVHIHCKGSAEIMAKIQEIVIRHPGPIPVVLHPEGSSTTIPLPARTRVRDDQGVMDAIRDLCGPKSWRWEDLGSRRSAPVAPSGTVLKMRPKPVGGPACPVR
ncbi:MAG: DNA polymerase III subunit alpha [Candidatus Dormibacteria bacterium]